MASYRLPLPLLAIVASLCGVAVAQRGDLIHPYLPYCSTTGNYTDGSQFKKNLKQLLSTLSSAAASNGWFQTSTVGTGDDTVFGLIMCYADSSVTQCLDCLAWAPEGVTKRCPGSRNAGTMYNACQLRYSDTNFFGKEVTYRINFNYVVWTFKPYATDMNTMIEARSQVMEELKERVPDSSLLLYNYTIPYNDSLLGTYVISGLAQCTRDMAPSESATGVFQCTLDGRWKYSRTTAEVPSRGTTATLGTSWLRLN
jgi:hypothetical protein